MFYNYKQYCSLVLMTVADSEYKFIFVDVGSYGKDADSTIFTNTSLWKAIESDQVKLLDPKLLNEQQPPVPFVVLADEVLP